MFARDSKRGVKLSNRQRKELAKAQKEAGAASARTGGRRFWQRTAISNTRFSMQAKVAAEETKTLKLTSHRCVLLSLLATLLTAPASLCLGLWLHCHMRSLVRSRALSVVGFVL